MPDTLTMVLVAVGTALAAVSAALWPLISKLLTSLIDNQAKFADLSSAYLLLAKVVAANQLAAGEKTFIVVVEDTPSHRRLIQGLLRPVAMEAGLTLLVVTNIDDALPSIAKTRLMVLDVMLNARDETAMLNRLIGLVPDGCDVIIHAAGDYPREQFPQVCAVLKKWESDGGRENALVTEARKALRLDASL